MHEINIEKTLKASAESVWAVIANFADLSWYPAAEKVEVIGEGIGQIRRITMPGMPEPIDEILTSKDDAAMRLAYSIPGGAMIDYKAGPVVTAIDSGQCRVNWHAEFTGVIEGLGLKPEDMVGIMTQTYEGMLQDIENAANAA